MRMKWREQLLAKSVLAGVVSLGMPGLLAVGTVVLAPGAMAQTQTGGLRVTVSGDTGQPLAGATVTVKSPSSLVSRTAVTGADGSARLSGLDPATNYTVEISAAGFNVFTAADVAVVSGQDRSVGYALAGSGGDVVIITGTSLAAVDVTSATVATTLTLDTVEALPTARSYQSYLQLVPGVKPGGGNPSSRSGVNYSDVGGTIGTSSDNVYYLDGVDVTDPQTGQFGANFNSEIIQEQQVLVGGVPAEYAGGSGLISKVITKSGSNEWHGSINYYLQNDGLVQKDKHNTSGGFSTYDTAITLGGPIIEDTLWIFGSYQKKNREDEVLNPNTGAVQRSVKRDDDYAFLKATWQITPDDRLSATYFSDPVEISGSSNSATLNNRDSRQIQGGDNWKLDYSRTWGDLLFNAYAFKHEGEVSTIAADQSVRDTITFRSNANSTIEQRNLGGAGVSNETSRDREEWGLNLEYYLDTDFGSHTFKTGYSKSENTYFSNSTVPGDVTYNSIDAALAGTTYNNYDPGTTGACNLISYAGAVPTGCSGWTARSFTNTADDTRILSAINGNATARASLDTDSDGTVSQAELDALVFSNTAGNPYGNVNVYRALRSVNAPYSVQSKGQTFYLQDTWTWDQLTINAGVRAEEWGHYASNGNKLFTFEWELAPRLSVVYDLFGDGRSKVFGFAGRYYDPIRTNMTNFAGNLSGPVTDEQINVNGTWVTFRTRGGPITPDSVFAPSTKTPYTDEFMIGYSTTFGQDIGVSVSATNRKTRDIFEDFDLALYSNPNGDTAHGEADQNSLFYLPYSYFGFSGVPNANYVLGTLPGGKRDYTGFEVVVSKYKTENWFGQVSYTYNDAKGNTNSDSNADYQGDWLALDPRAPNAYGPQPGNIEHQLKAFAAYDFDFGLQVSGVFNWNSGALYTPAELVQGRYFAPMATPYEYGGVIDSWYEPGGIGSEKNPSYYTFDMRFKYTHEVVFGEMEWFLDIFNVLNKQSATSEMPLLAGSGQYAFGEANNWVAPRRAYLGARFSF